MTQRSPAPVNRRPAFVIAMLFALLCTSCGGEAPVPKRVILISLDTARADRVSGWGDARTTPRLAAIAAEGTRFQRFYAASSYTIPSHMSIFTGLDPLEHGMLREGVRLAPGVPTLASLLGEAGFATQAFHEGGYIAPRFGFDHGFQSYVEVPRLGMVSSAVPMLLDWLRSRDDRPYFLFVHSYASHYPYGGYARHWAENPGRGLPSLAELARLRDMPDPPLPEQLCALVNQFADRHEDLLDCASHLTREFPASPHFEQDRAGMLRSYDDRIAQLDVTIGAIEQVLREQGRWEDTLLVVTSDHGEAFFENQGFSNHGYVPFDTVLHIPLVISFPKLLRQHGTRVVDALTWHLDLLPTILGLVGIDPPAGLAGRDLAPVMLGREALPDDRAVFPLVISSANRTQYPFGRVTLQGPLKWISGHEQLGDAEGQLFDLGDDPGEQRNLRAERGDEARRLAALGREWETGMRLREPIPQPGAAPARPGGSPQIVLPDAEREKLRALGYVD